MTVDWLEFVPGVLLLLTPADRLLSTHVELRSFDCFRRQHDGRPFRPWWWVPALWLDPLRAFGGAFLLRQSLALNTPYWSLAETSAYALMLAILAVGIVAQAFARRADRGVLLAPIGFIGGTAMALTPWPVGVIGIVAAFLGLFGFRQFYAFFAFGLAAILLLGFVLDAPPMWIIPAACAFALPIVLSLVTSSTLEFPVRDSSRPAK